MLNYFLFTLILNHLTILWYKQLRIFQSSTIPFTKLPHPLIFFSRYLLLHVIPTKILTTTLLGITPLIRHLHCLKSVRIRSYFGLYFPVFGLNTERYPVFSCIRTEYGEILRISPYSVRMRENTDQNNSKCGHSLRSAWHFCETLK